MKVDGFKEGGRGGGANPTLPKEGEAEVFVGDSDEGKVRMFRRRREHLKSQ